MSLPRRLVLLPGLAADERMYAAIGAMPIPVVTPRLLIPDRGETMAEYAARHARWLKIDSQDLIGGCSFGSMVAAEIARQQQVQGLILLSGALSCQALNPYSLRLRRFTQHIPLVLMRWLLTRRRFLTAVFGAADPEHIELGRLMIQQTPDLLLKRGAPLAATYTSNQPLLCPVSALHGAQDRVLSAPAIENLTVIADAGHGLVVSHPEAVTTFLSQQIKLMRRP